MSTTELRLNKNLLQKVLREKEDIPEDLKERITGSPVMNADRRCVSLRLFCFQHEASF
jgi:hypothetical protein